MDQPQHTIMANKFHSVFDASRLNERGHQLKFSQRQRQITPFRFGLSVIASMATQEVQSIADVQRQCNDLWDAEVSDKAFYNQLAKASCASFLLTSLSDIMGIDHQPFRFRLIASWNPETTSWGYLFTHLPRVRYPISHVCLGYKLRWQVELLLWGWTVVSSRLRRYDSLSGPQCQAGSSQAGCTNGTLSTWTQTHICTG